MIIVVIQSGYIHCGTGPAAVSQLPVSCVSVLRCISWLVAAAGSREKPAPSEDDSPSFPKEWKHCLVPASHPLCLMHCRWSYEQVPSSVRALTQPTSGVLRPEPWGAAAVNVAVAQGTRLALCMVLQGVCTGKHKQDEDTKALQKASCCSPLFAGDVLCSGRSPCWFLGRLSIAL